MRPTKKHDGQTITIKAGENCLDSGKILIGEYCHIERGQAFGFNPVGRIKPQTHRHCCLFSRDEWIVLSGIQETIARYMRGQIAPSPLTVNTFLGMLETGEATLKDFCAVGSDLGRTMADYYRYYQEPTQ